jgi:hypothetical protein
VLGGAVDGAAAVGVVAWRDGGKEEKRRAEKREREEER